MCLPLESKFLIAGTFPSSYSQNHLEQHLAESCPSVNTCRKWLGNVFQEAFFILKYPYKEHCLLFAQSCLLHRSQISLQWVTNSHDTSHLPVAVDWCLDLSRLPPLDIESLDKESLEGPLDCLFLNHSLPPAFSWSLFILESFPYGFSLIMIHT